MCIGRQYRPNYVADAIKLLKPKIIIPRHWDVFIDEHPPVAPGCRPPRLVDEIVHHGNARGLAIFSEFACQSEVLLD